MNPLEEKLVELLRVHKEEHGVYALHYLEAFHTLSRVVTAMFEGKQNDLLEVMSAMREEGKADTELFQRFTDFLINYHVQSKNLNTIQNDIGKVIAFQGAGDGLEKLLQSMKADS